MPDAVVDALRLRTLGGLTLAGAALSRPKPLLLLTYLALEGRQSRRHLAELFFADAVHGLQSLSVALSRLRSVAGDRLTSDDRTVEVDVAVDASDLLAALDRGDLDAAVAAYRGPFLEGVEIDGLGVEVEEWIYGTREFVADALREGLLRRAEGAAGSARFEEAGHDAEAAWHVAGASSADPSLLLRLHGVLLAGGRVLAGRIAEEARAWGAEVAFDAEAVRARLVATAQPRPGSVPPRAAGFVGRSVERAAVREALLAPGGRLVSLVGPGGVGKTRLALEVAADLDRIEAFPDGVFVVGLEDVVDGARVPSRVAHALGIVLDGADESEARLARSLRDRRALIVLDSTEHVQDGVAAIIIAAASAPGVRWLATSRERLLLHDEVPIALDGLAVPPESVDDPTALRASDALTLFVQRAERLRGAIPDDALPDVARLCRTLGGWPLAIEIAASLTRVMPLGELADELEARLDVLVDPARDTPDRHHSVVGTLESTWSRLGERDREALVRLSVFRGGFARVDAEAVASVGVAVLARLVDRALLRRVDPGRFELHPLVRRYADDHRRARPDGAEMVRTHARHFLARLAERTEDLRGHARDAVAGALVRDHANLRDAWTTSIESGDDAAWGPAALAFGLYLEALGRYREGVTWLGAARERAAVAGLAHAVTACVALHQGVFLARIGRLDAAEEAIAPALAAQDPRIRVAALETMAHAVELWRGRHADARRHLLDAEVIHRLLGDVAGEARSTFLLASFAWIDGEWDEAFDLMRTARAAFRGLADLHGEVLTTSGMGVIELDRGDLEAARRLLERAAARAAAMTGDHLRAMVQTNLAQVRLRSGDLEGLERTLEEALRVFGRVGDDPWIVETASYAARVAARTLRTGEAETYLRLGLETALRIGHPPSLTLVVAAAADLVARAAPDEAAALHAIVRDHPRTYASVRQASVAALEALGAPASGAHRRTPDGDDPLVAAAAALLHERRLPGGGAFALALHSEGGRSSTTSMKM